jgi:hypothetical protein
MSSSKADGRRQVSGGDEMNDRRSARVAKTAPLLVLAALAFVLGGCASTAMNCRLFGLQCDAPTAEQEARAADNEARLKQEDATLAKTGHYGTPYGGGPQYGEGGGDQYGYGPAYSYARQAPVSTDGTEPRQQ